jgi:integrase
VTTPLAPAASNYVRLKAATGLRVGELLAVRWRSVDFGLGTLAVRESVYEGKFQSPKTRNAIRTIPLGPQIVKSLVAHRARATRIASTGSRGG